MEHEQRALACVVFSHSGGGHMVGGMCKGGRSCRKEWVGLMMVLDLEGRGLCICTLFVSKMEFKKNRKSGY